MIDDEKKELGKWWIWILGLLMLSIIILNSLGMLSKFGSVFVERKVFEQSYQRSEGLKTQMITWQAQLASINSQLLTATADTKNQLLSQKAMLEIQIAQTKGL
ncbi:MAG: hypothetical protein J7L15_06370 [Clostridiales bacterium]|nr:hypothetical protein [Clostridiales bacterium]